MADADANSLTIQCQGSETTQRFVGGLTQEHYDVFAPVLSEEGDKATLALGVIENMIPAFSIHDWMAMKRIFYWEWENFDEWLLEGISREGFEAAANAIEKWWTAYRKINPPTPYQIVILEHPTWHSNVGTISLGNRRWRFKVLFGGPLMKILNEFEGRNWPPFVEFLDLRATQVRDVAKKLRMATRGFLNWTQSDHIVGWSFFVPKRAEASSRSAKLPSATFK